MEEREIAILVETEQRSKSNCHRIDTLENEMKDIKNEQKAIYKIATSVELIAQRVGAIEDKVDETGKKVDAQTAAWNSAERALSDRITQAENKPAQDTASRIASVRWSIITAICTALASGALAAIIAFMK